LEKIGKLDDINAQIESMFNGGKSQREIAKTLGIHRWTVKKALSGKPVLGNFRDYSALYNMKIGEAIILPWVTDEHGDWLKIDQRRLWHAINREEARNNKKFFCLPLADGIHVLRQK
jgi:hypothetical protein